MSLLFIHYSLGLFIGRFNDAGYSGGLAVLVIIAPFPLMILGFLAIFPIFALWIFSLYVLLKPSVGNIPDEYPETIVSDDGGATATFTMEDVPQEAEKVSLSVETRRLIDWYKERIQDGVAPEELTQAMRDAGHPEERIEEVLQNA